ncbi:hypothetical protein, partial [Paenibacillus xylanexedens]|uniref:hypothetical protein n=1 Tax=Paenibacillus xylanexedens TaxID=528191 RepID=UPI001C92E48D
TMEEVSGRGGGILICEKKGGSGEGKKELIYWGGKEGGEEGMRWRWSGGVVFKGLKVWMSMLRWGSW